MTATLGAVLLVTMPVVIVTGFLSYAAYEPRLSSNGIPGDVGILGFYLFSWPTSPPWLYALNQGLHVIGGIALAPVVLAKLWSVIPKLFTWPPAGTPAQALERLSLVFLVGGVTFEFATGILNVQYWYVFPFSFYTAHFYGAWVFAAAFVAHVAVKLPQLRRSLRQRRLIDELRVGVEGTRPDAPARPTLSRRGLLALVGGSSLTVLGLTVGQATGWPPRETALLAPRGRDYGDGPNAFQINNSAEAAGVRPEQAGEGWRLVLAGGARERSLAREELLALPLHTYDLPIACVEGWSTTQTWTGVRLRDLARLGGVSEPSALFVESLQPRGAFASTWFSAGQVADDQSLLALRVNGVDLSLDHGFPARIMVPAAPGVHQTKWVRRMTFRA
jgi:DMSO/TMAO reductase YedYZ molybdopterin-dependent catalytic subunit